MATSSLTGQNFFSTTLSSGISSSDTTIPLNSLPTGTEGYLIIEPDNSSNREIIYYTSKTGSAVLCPSAATGRGVDGSTAVSHSAGATVKMVYNFGYWNSLKDGTAFTDGVINTGKLDSASYLFNDFIATGGTIATVSGLTGSFSDITYWISGKKYTASSIANKTYTASKDTYVDISTSGTVTYVEVANGATVGMGLTANSVRVAKVVTSGAAITSITQLGSDPLGNLIYPTKNPKMTIIRQDDTTNTLKNTSVKVTGWGVGVPGATNILSEAITFPVTFTQKPIVTVTYAGDNISGSTTYGNGTLARKRAVGSAISIATTGFTASVYTIDSTNWTAGDTVFYTWEATGEVV